MKTNISRIIFYTVMAGLLLSPQVYAQGDESGPGNNAPQDHAGQATSHQSDSSSNTQAQSHSEGGTAAEKQAILDKINQLRATEHLKPLKMWHDACADRQAKLDMERDTGTGHPNFGMCSEMAQNTSPNWPSVAEVISHSVQQMWDEKNRPTDGSQGTRGHYENMVNQRFSEVAIGIYKSPNGTVWVNQNFK